MGGRIILLCFLTIISPFYTGATSDYNEISNSWTDANLEKTLSRVRRGLETSQPCCGETFFKSESFLEEMNECQKLKFQGTDEKNIYACLYECAGKKLDLVDEKGFVKQEEFAEFCPEFVEGDKSLQPLVEKIARENLVTGVNNLSKSMRRQYKCNPAMIFAINNLYFMLQLTCPDEFKNNTDECNNHRAEIIKMQNAEKGNKS
uniref:Chemosensory protein n=1 Tax=Blattella germanica TaxID=6973 RepID=A0A120HTV1_BLAGE|nr:chemosensory protein [Blattella germanica]